MKNFKLLRSLMFVPGHNERLLESAGRSTADALLLDIEDSVQPYENKKRARTKILEKVNSGLYKNHLVFPRVNDRESGELLKDVMTLSVEGVDGFVYPKSMTGQDVYFFDKLLETIEYEKGIQKGHFKIIPLIETTAAVLNAQDIIQASPRVIAVAFGCEDYITDLKGIHDIEGESIFTARSMIAMAARANAVIPIDTVHIRVHDLADLEKNLILAKKLGYEGMLVLHPKEIELVHKYFSPTKEDILNAQEMLNLNELARKEDKGVAIMNGKFIGPPMVLAAKDLLKKAAIIQKKEMLNE
jgi:citrate lyase subunit beta/citryl-CoA lyase